MIVQDGKVEDNLVPRPKPIGCLEGKSVTQIGAGKAHTLALTEEGEVLSFGLQTYGRLGRKEANTSSDKPLGPGLVELPGEDGVIAVAAGRAQYFSFFNTQLRLVGNASDFEHHAMAG